MQTLEIFTEVLYNFLSRLLVYVKLLYRFEPIGTDHLWTFFSSSFGILVEVWTSNLSHYAFSTDANICLQSAKPIKMQDKNSYILNCRKFERSWITGHLCAMKKIFCHSPLLKLPVSFFLIIFQHYLFRALLKHNGNLRGHLWKTRGLRLQLPMCTHQPFQQEQDSCEVLW